MPSLLDKLAPTAYAQGGGYTGADFGYDELWSESRNLVGSSRNRAIEPTALGPVLPEGSNFNFAVPLIATGLTAGVSFRSYESYGMFATFRSEGLAGRRDPVANLQIRVMLGPLWPQASYLGAWTSPITPTVIIGAGYFLAGPDRQGMIVAHEMLHIANPNLTHEDLAKMLGVDYKQDATNPDDEANKAVSDWIEKGCEDPPDKK